MASADRTRVVVVGAGISGLATAAFLRQTTNELMVLEQAARVGGVVETGEAEGFHFDLGPQSFQLSPALQELVRMARLDEALVEAPARAPRFVYWEGRLHAVPLTPAELVCTSLLSFSTKWRILTEPLRRSQPPPNESVAEFVRRKFGQQMLDRLVGPFVSGIYAGDPERLGLRDAFPELHDLERRYHSIVRGAVASRATANRSPRRLLAVRGGNGRLVDALGQSLGQAVRRGVTVTGIEPVTTPGSPRGWVLRLAREGEPAVVADAVVLAVPPHTAATLLGPVAPDSSKILQRVPTAPVAVVFTGYRREQIAHPLDGFGFLMAQGAWAPLLGTVWVSSLFPDRAPAGRVSLVSFLGGARYPEVTQWSADEAVAHVVKALGAILRISGAPIAWHVRLHRPGLPQYLPGHRERLEAVRKQLAAQGIFLVGNYVAGISLGACAELARRTAREVTEFLARS